MVHLYALASSIDNWQYGSDGDGLLEQKRSHQFAMKQCGGFRIMTGHLVRAAACSRGGHAGGRAVPGRGSSQRVHSARRAGRPGQALHRARGVPADVQPVAPGDVALTQSAPAAGGPTFLDALIVRSVDT